MRFAKAEAAEWWGGEADVVVVEDGEVGAGRVGICGDVFGVAEVNEVGSVGLVCQEWKGKSNGYQGTEGQG